MENIDNAGPSNLPPSLDPTRFRSVQVFIYTTSGLFSGYTYCQYQQRLLDALNKGYLTSKLQTSSDFLPLFNLDIISSDGKLRHLDNVLIRKTNILLVGEMEGPSSTEAANTYPIRRKKTLQTIINLPQVSLSGSVYSEIWEELQDSLNRSDQFIPLTNVEIMPPLPSGISKSSFVAINKDHIVYVGK